MTQQNGYVYSIHRPRLEPADTREEARVLAQVQANIVDALKRGVVLCQR